jgi:hypothetical protein
MEGQLQIEAWKHQKERERWKKLENYSGERARGGE